MLIPLLLGCLTIFISMGIQLVAVIFMLKYLFRILNDTRRKSYSLGFNAYVLGISLLMLFAGNIPMNKDTTPGGASLAAPAKITSAGE